MVVLYPLQRFIPFWNEAINKAGIANFHLLFNITNTILLIPFSGLLVKLVNIVVSDKETVKPKTTTLDSRFLSTPGLAVAQANRETMNMAALAVENYRLSRNAVLNGDITTQDKVLANENRIDELESKITRYLMQIVDEDLTESDAKVTSSLFHILIDIERVGDRCQNMFKAAERAQKEQVKFSDQAWQELKTLMEAVDDMLTSALRCYRERDLELAHRIQTYENVIDDIRRNLRDRHVERLSNQNCNFDAAIVFLDLIGNLERIADHSANIANRTEQLMQSQGSFDPHKDIKEFQKQNPELYLQYYREFAAKYPIE